MVIQRGLNSKDSLDLHLSVFLTVIEQAFVGERRRSFGQVWRRAHLMAKEREGGVVIVPNLELSFERYQNQPIEDVWLGPEGTYWYLRR